MPALRDETGNTYGRLTVVQRNGTASDGKAAWLCRCSCGSEVTVSGAKMRSGNTQSCGCRVKDMLVERNTTHGYTVRGRMAPEYNCWSHMVQRCTNPSNAVFKWYGGRGIRVHPEWISSFEAFLAHIGPRPSAKHSIERGNVNSDYVPGNVCWATAKQQSRNKTNNRHLIYCGRKITLAEAEEISPVTRKCISWRIDQGWSVQDAIETPAYGKNK